MPKPSDMITVVAGLMNDSSQSQYTNAVCLPMMNLALDELQEIYELNGLPITNETSAAITIPLPTSSTQLIIQVGQDTTPALPSDLIEIVQLWESTTGLNQWTPMEKRDFIPHYLEDTTTTSCFLVWSLEDGKITLLTPNQVNDIKIDYIGSVFNTPIAIANIGVNLPFANIRTYLEYKTAALCAMFIAENENRAAALDSLASTALSRALGIPVKGMQSITIRRRPFRYSFKNRKTVY